MGMEAKSDPIFFLEKGRLQSCNGKVFKPEGKTVIAIIYNEFQEISSNNLSLQGILALTKYTAYSISDEVLLFPHQWRHL
ncbi:hypothetical protein KFK09_006360 [Dendrobium nobile]|uniref:Uncharacterized protein n=1 Tax=Dendrobium nobile TaxID=94219 RepID=A0A8T3BTJ1_DENNO|nr:hypothetical protein KFK09_006360 [Dendrobium nobile]